MNDKTMIAAALVLIIAVGAILYGISPKTSSTTDTTPTTTATTGGSGEHLALAQCLKDKGAIFYGAFWCPHCKAQKAEFGDAVPALPYVECATPDGQGQNAICTQKHVQSYPTWVFPDGSRLTGEQPLATLAAKVNCPLTAGTSTAPTEKASSTNVGASSAVTL